MTKEKIKTLEVLDEKTKKVYTRVLIAFIKEQGELHPKQLSDLYLFMSQIGLSSESRHDLRAFLSNDSNVSFVDVLHCLMSEMQTLNSEEQEAMKFSIIKDLARLIKAANYNPRLDNNLIITAEKFYPEKAEEILALVIKSIDNDEKFLKDEISISEFEKRTKDLASKAAAVGVPIAAVYFSGSVVGLSAAGITSGLAALGFGGLLGLSSMITGIGTVVILGVMAYKGVRWILGKNERELRNKREKLIQDILKTHQKAINILIEDINELANKLEQYMSQSNRNEELLEKLKRELEIFKAALNSLEERKEQFEI
ncbi:hypothetical protein NSS70_19035 [Aeribacillus sp. FSL K6-2848]|uniref:hypothetical protein n=1 Tax=unclassified Aeribacillus TaxID=2640495 RepID=UPI002871611F|nr:hypothetical protein [Aeribacillus pallidus]